MSETAATYHDAQTGFHDIKPLLHRETAETSLDAYILMLLALCAAIFIFRALKKRSKKVEIPDPLETALVSLSSISLDSGKSEKEQYAIISQCIRRFLTEELRAPCTDKTTRELTEILPNYFTIRLPVLRTTRKNELEMQVISMLQMCEEKVYQPELNCKQSVTQACTDAIALLKKISQTIRDHDQQNNSILAQSKVAT